MSETKPTVAVVMPAYNAESYIERGIKSAFAQTYRPDEVIVASDGSTDKTVEVARSLGARVLDLPKANANVARNAAIRSTDCDFIFMLDADDWFMEHKIEMHLAKHLENPWSLVFDPGTWIDSSGKEYGLSSRFTGQTVDYRDFTCRSYWFGGSTYSFRRSQAEEIGFFREELTSQQDLDFWIRLAHHIGLAYVLDESQTYYYINPFSLSRNPKRVVANMRVLLAELDFLPHSLKRRFWGHVLCNAADHTVFPSSIPLLARTLDRPWEPRIYKALARSIQHRMRKSRVL
jgi:glycosyltransferase involved in cell wall biosynthesis